MNKRFKRLKRNGGGGGGGGSVSVVSAVIAVGGSSGGKGPKGSSPPLPPLPLIALQDQDDRSSILSDSSAGRRPSTASTSLDMNEDLSHQYHQFDERPSFQSTRSTVLGHDLNVHQVSAQQARKRWWDPERKEATSIYAASDAASDIASISEYDREKYLASLLQGNQDQDVDDWEDQEQEGHDDERESALNALLENSRTIMSLPIPAIDSRSPSPMGTREIVTVSRSSSIGKMTVSRPATAPQSPVLDTRDQPQSDKKSSKAKLLPISTPLAQLLQLSNAEELWQYVQQAKTYAATRMDKGDKRSAAIALKRAQALEARWQQVLLEMASSEGDEDDLLLDDDDDNEENNHEDHQMAITMVASSAGAAFLATKASTDTLRRHEDCDASRSDNAPDMYSKYKVNTSVAASTLRTTSSSNSLASRDDDGDDTPRATMMDGLLGPEATLEQMLATTDKEHLEIYIQRLKTDTVAMARSGSKYAALQIMKNVKVLQQRLVQLEEDEYEDEDDN